MVFSLAGKLSRCQMLSACIALIIGNTVIIHAYAEEEFEFNTDVLDLSDRNNVDLSQFSRAGYIMPGRYTMVVHLNKNDLPETSIEFIASDEDTKKTIACLTPELIEQFGLKPDVIKKLTWIKDGLCLNYNSLDGLEARGDIASSSLYLNIPQAYLEYTAENWDPPSRWDEGINGFFVDYNLNAQAQKYHNSNTNNRYSLSGMGTTGVNLGAWRVRADWQTKLMNEQQGSESTFDWSRFYAYRAVTALMAKATLGEGYLDSAIFDSFRFMGASLISDDTMLPPNLRGYAPEVTGVAKTNATVIISQQGRVLYETQVAAGPFRIQDLNDAVSGELNVVIKEQDGTTQEFTMNTSSIPYLTRPGLVQYKFTIGRPTNWNHRFNGPVFGNGEFSWGVNNGWSLYGGTLGSQDYHALSVGIGRDLLVFGALSADITQSWAQLPQDSYRTGASYRLSYSKNFDKYDSQVTFAGYRFSQEDYMSMSEYLDARNDGSRAGKSKEMYTISLNKHFRDLGLSTYLNFYQQSYWDKPSSQRYNLSVSRYFSLGNFKNLSLSLSAYRSRNNGTNDDGVTVSLGVPLGNATVTYTGAFDNKDNSHNIGYFSRINDKQSYNLVAGGARKGANLSGYFTNDGDYARLNTTASYSQGRYSSVGANMQGGLTLTAEGGALHRSNIMGGTRMLLDTQGVANVPVRGYGSEVRTNSFGKAVITDVNSYYRNRLSIDVNKLGRNAEATTSVVQATLTEGAFGYRKFDVISGAKAMAVIKSADGSAPPFGATVMNKNSQTTGLVNDDGNVYLSGVTPGAVMSVHWAGEAQCQISVPMNLPADMLTNLLLLPCEAITEKSVVKTI